MNDTNPRTGLLLGWVGGAVVTALVMMTLPAAADGDPATDDVGLLIPYQGYLEKAGEPVDTEVDVTFRLWDGDTERFSEQQTVSVFAGRFNAVIGGSGATASDALATALRNADDLELEVAIDDAGVERVLSNRKPLTVAPYALVSRGLVAPEVGGRFVVESTLVVSDDSSVAPLVITDGDGARLVADGDEVNSDGVLNLDNAESVTLGGDLYVKGGALKLQRSDGTAVEVASANDDGQLVINRDANAASLLYLDSATFFEGSVTGITGEITVVPNSCNSVPVPFISGSYTYECPDGYAWTGGKWFGDVLNGSMGLSYITCCQITATVH